MLRADAMTIAWAIRSRLHHSRCRCRGCTTVVTEMAEIILDHVGETSGD